MMGLLLVLLMAGCSKDDLVPPVDKTTVPRNMGVFIENNYDLSLLSAALKKTGLLDSLNQPGAITLFAPDNAAFNRIGISTPAEIDRMDVDSLRFMLRYHMIRNRYFITTFPKQMDNKYLSLTGDALYVSVDKQEQFIKDDIFTFVNGAYIMTGAKRNIALANGVIHILAKPLQYKKETVQDYISKDTSLVLFAAVMKQFHLWNDLETKDPLTLFVPDNAAFLKYGLTAEKIATLKPADYQPLAFGIYTLMMRPMHIFSVDGYILSGTNVYGANMIYFNDTYSIGPSYMRNNYLGTEESAVYIGKRTGPNWGANEEGPAVVQYKGGLTNAYHLCSNGIVHIIDDLVFNPDLMKQ